MRSRLEPQDIAVSTAPEPRPLIAEARRVEEARTRTKHWRRWGPDVSDRAWGSVREDYSAAVHYFGDHYTVE